MKNEELNIKNLTQNNNLRCKNHLCAKLSSKLQYLTTKKQQTKVCCSLKFGKSAGARTAKPKRGYLIAQPQASNNFNYPRNP